MEQGLSPNSTVLDNLWIIPGVDDEPDWRPQNYDGTFWGRQPLYKGLEWSRNLMTIRLANEVGMGRIVEIARDFGIDDSLPPYLSISLGTAETTLMDLTSAYGMLVNGGKQIEPTLIDRVQDRYGRTLFRHERRNCAGCNDAEDWDRTSMPVVFEHGEQVTSELAAYHVVSMLRGVVERGTAARRVGLVVDRPVGGKTGTTQESKDAWFSGFSPDLVVGVYVGFDQPRLGAKNPAASQPHPFRGLHQRRACRHPGDPVPLPGCSDFEHRPAHRRDRRAHGGGRRPGDHEGEKPRETVSGSRSSAARASRAAARREIRRRAADPG